MSFFAVESLFPEPGPAGPDAYDQLDLVSLARADRPYIVANMVASVDGQARIGETTDALGGPVDQALFIALRGQADCVMAGTRTIGAEQYNPAGRSEQRRRERVERGVRECPLFATVTRSGRLPVDAPLMQAEDQEIVVFCDSQIESGAKARLTVEPVVDPLPVVQTLRNSHGVRSLLIEGGPLLLTPFIAARLLDELFLTIDPKLVGDGPGCEKFPILNGVLDQHVPLDLVSVLRDKSTLFLRYRLGTGPADE